MNIESKIVNKYKLLKEKHQKEIEEFPMFFAFNQQQFNEGMLSVGLNPDDTAAIYKIGRTGGYFRKSDSKRFEDMMRRHGDERQKSIDGDTTGDGYIFDMFFYELCNHEYGYSGELSDTLDALGLSIDEINASPKLKYALNKAKIDVRRIQN